MGPILMFVGSLGIITGLVKLVNLKNIPVTERKKGLILFAWSLLIVMIGYMLHLRVF